MSDAPPSTNGEPPAWDVPVDILQRLYANVPLMMGVVELHGDDDILHVSDNPATAAFFGTTPEATRGKLASALGVDVETRRHWIEHYRESQRTQRLVRFEYPHEAPGGRRWLEAMVSHIGFEPSTGQERYAYSVEDVTERVVQRETARATEQRQAALIRALPDLIFRLDPDGRYLDVHAPDPDVLAAPAESLLGRSIEEVLPAPLAEEFLTQIRGSLDTGVVSEVEYDMVTSDGVKRHFEARMSPDVEHQEALLVVRDLTEWTKDRRDLSATAERLRTLIDSLKAAVLMEDEGRQVLVVNQAFCDLFEVDAPPSALAGADAMEALQAAKHHFRNPEDTVERIEALIGARQAVLAETIEFANGKTLERDYIPVALDGAYRGHLWLYHDITERVAEEQERQKREARYRLLAENTRDLIGLHAADGAYEWISPSVVSLLGYAPAELIGTSPFALVHPDDVPRVQSPMDGHLFDEGAGDGEASYRIRKKDGTYVWFETLSRPILDASGQVVQFQTASRDVTERKEMEEVLYSQAFHDALTGLPNRAMLNARLEAALNAPEGSGEVAVVFIDLDRFKVVNDTLGHSSGDGLLQEVAARLERLVRAGDTVARLGGDEFALLIDGLPNPEYAETVAQRTLDALRVPVEVDGRSLYAGASVGLATGRPGHTDPDALLREADLAMYEAKAAGRNTYAVYDEDTHGAVTRRLQLEMDLRHAVERGELRVVYQPIVGLHDGSLAGFEALVRWEHPQLGLLKPEAFIDAAEESGQTVHIDQWVLHEACRQTATWTQARGPERAPLRIHVNCSGRDLASSGFAAAVLQALDGQGLSPEHLSLEITERTLVQDTQSVSRELQHLQQSGIRFSLDDFGTGYSSLSMLNALPVDTIKVDRSFVGDMDASPESRQLVETVVGLGRMLDKSVVAEGIEGWEQLGALRHMDCAYGQGYFFNHPLSTADATALALSDTPPWHGYWASA